MDQPNQRTSGTDASQAPSRHRRLRNVLLDPHLQLRVSGYFVGAAGGLSAALVLLLWRAYREASSVVALGDPRADEAISALLHLEDRARMLWIGGVLLGVLLFLLGLGIAVTHRIAGPALVLARACRAVADGALPRPRPLRRGDLLVGLAGEMGTMLEALRAREEEERARMDEAARALASGAPERARAIVEALAAEKSRRLLT